MFLFWPLQILPHLHDSPVDTLIDSHPEPHIPGMLGLWGQGLGEQGCPRVGRVLVVSVLIGGSGFAWPRVCVPGKDPMRFGDLCFNC